ncbi:hypothetical protein KDL01_20000 [Actinospica durhamensis]|uniref:DUF1963 domain-containing protein n=1 Tax=Actinospica durhamensis TaxID=1508375 RepID=A0A941ER03_9ACTN|nr:hypothetical protein [Actinospica durhamensis]MBR7835568.1 hypothetical protein [Actinospica durhamensis]
MVDTTPPGHAVLLAQFPELADYARPALRLHPRRGHPSAATSSVGGPLLWPVDEPWPTCDGSDHDVADGSTAGPFDEPVVMASVLQLYRRDLPAGILPAPGWEFPDGTDLLQVLWCPNLHMDTYGPRVRVFWRIAAHVHTARVANPTLNTSSENLGIDNLAPHPCVIHPETVVDFPPIARVQGDGCADPEFLYGVLPAPLEQACLAWTVDGALPDEESWNSDRGYRCQARVPGWKLGGWIRDAGFYPEPSQYCDCGAPAFSLLDTTFEGLDGPWQPVAEPEISWSDLDDGEWDGQRSPGIWGGRNGDLWLLACSADSSHTIRAQVE